MKSALRSLLLVSLIVLICVGLAWLFLKAKASSEAAPKPVPTQFFSGLAKFLVVAHVTDMKLDEVSKLPSNMIFFVDVQVSKDRVALISKQREFTNPNYNPSASDRSPETQLQKLGTRYMKFEEIKKADPQVEALTEALKSDPQRRFILNIIDYPEEADGVLAEAVSSANADERIIFHSEQDGPLSDLRKLKPMWLYGTSRAQLVQTLWLTKLGLEAIAPLKGDVLISPLYSADARQKTLLISPELIREARRRSMKVLIGPADSSEFEEIRKLGVDGVITPQTSEFGFPQL